MEEHVLMKRIYDEREARMRSQLFWALVRLVLTVLAAAIVVKYLIILAKKYFLN